ncbi:MAG: carboxynorspermidine decarboxylase [Spirochaetaceae bacterium]|nr:MAG: carboxynorspermidine decarboxylase [Spirochaetaceae bacterium]
MERDIFIGFDPNSVPSPCYVIDEAGVDRNLAYLREVQEASGARILMALKAFALPALFPRIRRVLDGVCASGPWEARLGRECFGGEVHTFAPAFSEQDMNEVLALSDHVVFNSFNQWKQFRVRALAAQRAPSAGEPSGCGRRKPEFGIRVNPEHSEAEVPLYDPAAPYSRLGVTAEHFEVAAAAGELEGLSGLHMHTLCEQGFDALERTVEVLLEKFGRYLPQMQWLNLGGGHHISRPDYNRTGLIELIRRVRSDYDIDLILEPGEAVVIRSGALVATVLDVIHNGMPIAILDTSATAHMPDVLEMPYRPDIVGAAAPNEKAHTYRLGGQTCLAGDVIGDYSFDEPLQPGQRLLFEDMAHYTFIKSTMFNGVRHPALALYNSNSGVTRVVREFSYTDFLGRLT